MKKTAIAIVGLAIAFAIMLTVRGNDRPPSLCRIILGVDSNHEILVGRSGTNLLVFRDGTTNCEPESYAMIDGRLAPDCIVPPFKYGNAQFQLTSCHEYNDDSISPSRRLMLHGQIQDGNVTFQQYGDVGLCTDHDSLRVAHFCLLYTSPSPRDRQKARMPSSA